MGAPLLRCVMPSSGKRTRLLHVFGQELDEEQWLGLECGSSFLGHFKSATIAGSAKMCRTKTWPRFLLGLKCVNIGAHMFVGVAMNGLSFILDLINRAIKIAAYVWIGATAVLAPGTEIKTGTMLSLVSLVK